MGKAARMKKERRKYSLLDPVVELSLKKSQRVDEKLERGENGFNGLNSTSFLREKIAIREERLEQSGGSIVALSQEVVQTDLNWMYVYGDIVPTFIEDSRLCNLFASTKVPNLDIRNLLRQLPHLSMSFNDYERQFDSSIVNTKEMEYIRKGRFIVQDSERYTDTYLRKNVSVHFFSGCLFVPREVNKYCISFYSRWFEDDSTGEFYFSDIDFRGDGSIKSGCLNDVMFVSTTLDQMNGKLSKIVCAMSHNTIGEMVNDKSKFIRHALRDQRREQRGNVEKIYDVYKFVMNYIYYINTYPDALKTGLPESDVFKNGANQLQISSDIDLDLVQKSQVRMESVGSSGTGSTRCPHYRSGHYRVFKSEWYKKKRFETVYVAPTFVHQDVFSTGHDSFKVLKSKSSVK